MNPLLKVRIYFYINKLLFIIALLIIVKFIFDFYFISNKEVINSSNVNYKYDKFIIQPRLQTENNGFEYIKAKSGFMENGNYYFSDVNAIGAFGTIEAGQLEILNDNILNFSIKPKFSVIIEDGE